MFARLSLYAYDVVFLRPTLESLLGSVWLSFVCVACKMSDVDIVSQILLDDVIVCQYLPANFQHLFPVCEEQTVVHLFTIYPNLLTSFQAVSLVSGHNCSC